MLLLSGFLLLLCACETNHNTPDLNALSLEELNRRAAKEPYINSLAMPDTWVNWGDMWSTLEKRYHLRHTDFDMSSAEELALFEAEKNTPTKDIGDVGKEYGIKAKEQGLTLAYKTSYWDEIPSWAKDDEGHWIISYTGTMAFLINNYLVDKAPSSWQDLRTGDYVISLGDVMSSSQAQHAVYAAALSQGGSAQDLQPGIDFWKEIAAQGRLDKGDNSPTRIAENQIPVACLWDFNALHYRELALKIHTNGNFTALIPSDGTIRSGYTTIINAKAPHPYAVALVREYIFSDEGQLGLAKGFATPIREVYIPLEIQAKRIPAEQYVNVHDDTDYTTATVDRMIQLWKEQVVPLLNQNTP